MTGTEGTLQILRDALVQIEGSQDAAERASVLTQLLKRVEDLAQLYRMEPAKFTAFQLRVRGIRGMASQIDAWVKPIKAKARDQEAALVDRARRAAEHESASLDALTESLKVAGLMAPIGYRVDPGGIWSGDDRIALEPVVLVGVTRDLESDALRWELAWKWRGRWWRRSVERDVALDGRRLQRLAEYGLPVHSDNATAMVRYLAELEATNLPLIQERATTGRMGWLRPRVFQLGAECLGAETVLMADGGLADVASGWSTRGKWDAWHEAIRRHLRRRPLVQLAIYAAAVAPLLTILDLDGFVVDWSGATSRGKTSALRVAASIWGDPDRLVGSWGTASVVGPQEIAAFLHSLPLILDDTKLVGAREDIVARMLYDIPGGKERTRGQASGGLRKIKTWRTVLLSTGEKAVTDFSEDAGARARSLCIRGAPFGSDSTANRKATEGLTAAIRAHHGHLGRRLLDRLIGGANWDALRDRYREHRDRYGEKAGGSVSRRLAEKVAALELAAELCHDLGCPGRSQMAATMDVAWEAALRGGMDSDRPSAAWRALFNWVTANADRFDGARKPQKDPPPVGWAGRWDRGLHSSSWTTLAVYPQLARELLDRWGYDRDYCLNEWARRGWLDSDRGRHTKKVRVGGSLAWMLVFRFDGVAELLKD